MKHKKSVEKLAFYCDKNLDLSTSESGNDYGYPNLPLCVIDAVFSIGVTYAATQNTVNRFCDYFNIPANIKNSPLPNEDDYSISQFIDLYDKQGIEKMTTKIFQNRNRTSSRSGILKTEAVLMFAKVLKKYNADFLNDLGNVVGNPKFEAAIQNIPGQKSGISLRYFYMLAGEKNYIKPDRMILRFIERVIGQKPNIEEATSLLVETCSILNQKYPLLSPRKLDNLIWEFQRVK